MAVATPPARTPARSLERQVQRDENVLFVKRARFLGLKAVYGGQYEPTVAEAAGRELVYLADRRLAQINGGGNDAA